MAINWHATLWRSLAAEARKAVRMIGNRDVKLQTAMIAVRYVVEAVRAERAVNRCRDVSRQSEKVYKLPRCLIDAGLLSPSPERFCANASIVGCPMWHRRHVQPWAGVPAQQANGPFLR